MDKEKSSRKSRELELDDLLVCVTLSHRAIWWDHTVMRTEQDESITAP